VLETYLNRNRDSTGFARIVFKETQEFQNEVPYQILQKERDFAEDLKAKYEAQVIAHTRTEKKTTELERQLENERRKSKIKNTDLVK